MVDKHVTALLAVLSALACASIANAVTLGSGGDARTVDLGQTFDLAGDRHAAAQTYVVTAGPGKFEKMRKVAILNFCTQFVYSKSARGTSSGANMFYQRSSDGGIDLDLARMTQISNDLYDQVEAGLRAAGLELVPFETLAANPAFQKFARAVNTQTALDDQVIDDKCIRCTQYTHGHVVRRPSADAGQRLKPCRR